jgi:hypothetical protein
LLQVVFKTIRTFDIFEESSTSLRVAISEKSDNTLMMVRVQTKGEVTTKIQQIESGNCGENIQ